MDSTGLIQKGEFNVPIGTKTAVAFARKYLFEVSGQLKKAAIREADFEEIIGEAGPGDFVYVDPPYTVMHNNNNFLKYNDVLFSWKDQICLAQSVRRASKRGALILVFNETDTSAKIGTAVLGLSERWAGQASLLAMRQRDEIRPR